MICKSAQVFALWFLALAAVAVVSARSAHFGDTNQATPEQENEVNLVESSGLTPLQLEMLARLSAYNNQIPPLPAAWDRLIRAPEMKRQSRYRQCYFNPISCFKK